MGLKDKRETYLRVIEAQSRLSERFSDIKRIGTKGGDGTFSLIFDVLDEHSNRRVALKVFNPQYYKDSYRWQCFKREPEVLKQFHGAAEILQWIAPIDSFSFSYEKDDLVFEEEFSYYAVELASGDAESAVMLNKWTWLQKLDRFRAMCRSVQRIHAAGVAHRDIKLSNFLTHELRTMLCDFGTARSLVDGTDSILRDYTLPVGDMTYASPELFAGMQDADPTIYFKSDLYALGATFFELLTRTPMNPHLFDDSFTGDLARTMGAVPRSSRTRIYHELVPTLEQGHPLPPIQDFVPDIPKGILEPIGKLYRGLCAIDYRRRLCDFNRIFSYVNQATIILNNERAYQQWRQRREQYRRNAELKRSNSLKRRGVSA